MEANRKQAMVPEGSVALDPVGTAPGLVVPAGERVVIVLPGPAARAAADVAARRWRPSRCARCSARATPLRGYTMRMFGVPESEIAKSLREIEDDGVDVDAVEITTCLRRGEIEIDVRYRDETEAVADAGPRRAGRAPPARDSSASTARRSTPRWRSCCSGRRAGAGRVLQRRPAGGADHRRAGRLRVHGRQRRRLLERGQGGAAGGRPGADRGARARSRRRWPRRWRSGRWSASAPTSRSRSPASPGPTAAARRSRSATSASTPASPTAPRSPASR